MDLNGGERAGGGGARQAHRQPRRRGPGGGSGGGGGVTRMYRGGAAADELPLNERELGPEDDWGPGPGMRQLAWAAVAVYEPPVPAFALAQLPHQQQAASQAQACIATRPVGGPLLPAHLCRWNILWRG
jgi:hypothetical protein